MDLKLFLILCLIPLSSSQVTVKPSKPTKLPSKTPLTTPTILKTLTTAKHSEAKSLKSTDSVPTTTPLPTATSPRLVNVTKIDKSKKSNGTEEILNGQEQAQRPYIGGRGRQNGFQPTLGPNTPNYNPNYGVPFNAFIPQGLPFSGSPGSNNGLNNLRPGFYNPRDQINNNNNLNNHNNNNQQRQLSGPLDLLSGFIPTPGPGGPYTGTPTPFGQPVTGYPGYPNYPGLNPNYGPVNTPGLNNNHNNNGFGAGRGTPNVYNQLGGAGAPETGLGDNAEAPEEGEEAEGGQGADGNASNEGGEGENGGEDESAQPDYGGTSDNGETGADNGQGGEGEATGAGGEGEGGGGDGGGQGGDPSNDPDLAQFQNFQGGNFPGDLFPPGILSQQDLNDIQKSIEEQQKKEAEKKKQEEEASSAQPEYDYDNANGNGNGDEETSTETPANIDPSNYNQPIAPNHQNQYNQQRGLNNAQGAYANNNNRLNPQINNQYGLNSGSLGNTQRKANRPVQPNYQQNQFDDNVGYNNNNDQGSGYRNQDYDYNGSGERGINQGIPRSKGDNSGRNRYNNYQNGAYSSGESNDYDNNNANNNNGYSDSRTPSYPRGSNFNRFNDEAGRYRPGSLGRSSYRGADVRDFGGHSANSEQQNDVEPGVDYSPDPIYDSKRLRKQDNPRRLSGSPNRQISVGRNNRFSGMKPSVDYDGETQNYPGSTRKPRFSSPQLESPISTTKSSKNKPQLPSFGKSPIIRNNQQSNLQSRDSSLVDYDEEVNNIPVASGHKNRLDGKVVDYDSSSADYTDDPQPSINAADNNSGSADSLPTYRQTPRFVASERKENKRLANNNYRKSTDPFLRG